MVAENSAKGTFDDTWTESGGDEMTAPKLLSLPSRDNNVDQGPCLYLGPSGQRCDRRALAGGYCASHRPGGINLPKIALSKRALAAIAAASWFLWPYIGEVVREIIRCAVRAISCARAEQIELGTSNRRRTSSMVTTSSSRTPSISHRRADATSTVRCA